MLKSAMIERIKENAARLLAEVPAGVTVVAAAKTRSPEEIMAAVESGIRDVGENYIQEAISAREKIGEAARWHFIGHLQSNKVKKAVEIFDLIQTVDSFKLAAEISKRASAIGRTIAVLIEVNSAKEEQKHGVFPEEALALASSIAGLPNLEVEGLMTMGPFSDNPGDCRPYFRLTRSLWEELASLETPRLQARYLSMGMSDSWREAIEEGANMIRVGTLIFGPRPARGY